MEIIIVFILLLLLELLYFYWAKKLNITDEPNFRSSHSYNVIRGGGVIFPFAFIFFLIAQKLQLNLYYINFGIGLFLICGISFIDDIKKLSIRVRLAFHFTSAVFLVYSLEVFTNVPIWVPPLCILLVIGIINAFNFMDGINGMTGLYSLTVLFSLLYVNREIIHFVEERMIIYPILASFVILVFNFRRQAKIFMGDVGSMGIAFWTVSLLGLLLMGSKEYKWVLFLTVYGVEVVITILERLKHKENIFHAHRKHLYDLFANELNIDQRWISFFYAFIQLIINIFVVEYIIPDWQIIIVVLLLSILIYMLVKMLVKKVIKKSNL